VEVRQRTVEEAVGFKERQGLCEGNALAEEEERWAMLSSLSTETESRELRPGISAESFS
jgi:hypothetical protein